MSRLIVPKAFRGLEPFIANLSYEAMQKVIPSAEMVLISITEPTWRDKCDIPSGYHATLLLDFDDMDPDKYPQSRLHYDIFSDEDAQKIHAFILEHRGKNIIVHCAAGISRSGGVVEAILELFPEYEDRGYPRHPNNYIKRILKRVFGLVPIGG